MAATAQNFFTPDTFRDVKTCFCSVFLVAITVKIQCRFQTFKLQWCIKSSKWSYRTSIFY